MFITPAFTTTSMDYQRKSNGLFHFDNSYKYNLSSRRKYYASDAKESVKKRLFTKIIKILSLKDSLQQSPTKRRSHSKYTTSSQWMRHNATSSPSLLLNPNYEPILETIVEETEHELIQLKD